MRIIGASKKMKNATSQNDIVFKKKKLSTKSNINFAVSLLRLKKTVNL